LHLTTKSCKETVGFAQKSLDLDSGKEFLLDIAPRSTMRIYNKKKLKPLSISNEGFIIFIQKQYFPPPLSENYIFPPLATRRFVTPIMPFLP
jgi:hypothetical protein